MECQLEQRACARVPVGGWVRLKTPHHVFVEGSARDLSMRGVYVETFERLPLEMECEVSLQAGGRQVSPVLCVLGQVARMDEDGLGVRFLAIDAQSLELLRQVLVMHARDGHCPLDGAEDAVPLARRYPRYALW